MVVAYVCNDFAWFPAMTKLSMPRSVRHCRRIVGLIVASTSPLAEVSLSSSSPARISQPRVCSINFERANWVACPGDGKRASSFEIDDIIGSRSWSRCHVSRRARGPIRSFVRSFSTYLAYYLVNHRGVQCRLPLCSPHDDSLRLTTVMPFGARRARRSSLRSKVNGGGERELDSSTAFVSSSSTDLIIAGRKKHPVISGPPSPFSPPTPPHPPRVLARSIVTNGMALRAGRDFHANGEFAGRRFEWNNWLS
jgi:hypothetical protein